MTVAALLLLITVGFAAVLLFRPMPLLQDEAGILDLEIPRGTDYALRVQIKDDAGTAINITGWSTWTSVFYVRGESVSGLSFAVTVNDEATGDVTFSLTDTQATGLSWKGGRYEIYYRDAAGVDHRLLKGGWKKV